MDSSNNTMDIPLLRGCFLKEKKETFKRRGSIISRSGTNRRWFTIENIVSSSTNKNSELALCYYKRSSDQESSGWMFLNDVLSITQDAGTRWITIEHPSRILRIQSPTPAQHRVWFSALSKSCSNVQKEITLSSSSGHDKRPNLPWLMNPSVRRTSADHVISTPKDELKFLREITGQVDSTNEKENEPKNLLRDIDDSPISLKASCPIIHSFIDQDVVEGKIHSLLETVDHPNIKQTTNRIHQSIKHSTQSGVKNNVEPYNVCSSSHESIDSTSDDGISVPREGELVVIFVDFIGQHCNKSFFLQLQQRNRFCSTLYLKIGITQRTTSILVPFRIH